MTLNTSVFVLDEADPRAVFGKARELLGADHRHPVEDRDRFDGQRSLGHPPGIGLNALSAVTYRPDGPLVTAEQTTDEEEFRPPCWLDLWFDTTYSFSEPPWGSCGALHVELVARMGAWLDEQGWSWAWQNEFTGDIHSGPDKYERLMDLVEGSEYARSWLRRVVLPAVALRES